MSSPKINITNVSTYKISNEEGMDSCVVSFVVDQDIIAYKAQANGINHTSGLSVGKSDTLLPSTNLYPSDYLYPIDWVLPKGVEQIFVIYFYELQQDGEYRINIYGLNEQGEWTSYE